MAQRRIIKEWLNSCILTKHILGEARLPTHKVFMVSSSVIYALVTNKRTHKNTPETDEVRLIGSILKAAYTMHHQKVSFHVRAGVIGTANLLIDLYRSALLAMTRPYIEIYTH